MLSVRYARPEGPSEPASRSSHEDHSHSHVVANCLYDAQDTKESEGLCQNCYKKTTVMPLRKHIFSEMCETRRPEEPVELSILHVGKDLDVEQTAPVLPLFLRTAHAIQSDLKSLGRLCQECLTVVLEYLKRWLSRCIWMMCPSRQAVSKRTQLGIHDLNKTLPQTPAIQAPHPDLPKTCVRHKSALFWLCTRRQHYDSPEFDLFTRLA